jgi:carbon-monoxide dehydrogenase large subunit
MPSRTPGGTVIDVGDFHRVLDRAVDLADWNGFPMRRRASEEAGRLRGIGIGFFAILAGSAVQSERMDIRIDRDATVVVHAGTFATGQGHETMYAQMMCDWLNVPLDKVRVVQGDTDQVITGRGTFAARSMMVGGAALRGAADAVIAKAGGFAAHMLEVAPEEVEFSAGVFRARGTNRTVTLADVARQSYAYAGNPPALGVGIDGSGGFVAPPTVPNGCVIVEVEVDPETGLVTVDRCTSVDDCGVVINPLTATGQIHGAMAQGFGEALVEQIRYDSESGQLLTGSFMDYGMPRADLIPFIVNDFVEIPATSNPLGVKGVSEGSSSGAPPAVANAVIDALRALGVVDLMLPLTPERVWKAIQAARSIGK